MLELKNLCFGVESEDSTKEIIRDVSFIVPDEKFVVITGPNGGGKSTLARLIMGIEKPSSGRIFLDGKDITELGITERAKLGISFALQQPVRFKGIHVVDLLRLASGNKKLSVSDACEYLSAVGLCARDYITREVNASLSGGEMKRIEISVFDEPEAGIDLWSFQSLIQVFENMQKRSHASILIISHQERILEIADSIILIAEGQVRGQGSKEEMLPELMKSTIPVTCNRILEGGVKNAD